RSVLGGVDVGAAADVGDQLLHVERLRVDNEDLFLQVQIETLTGNGGRENRAVQQLRLVLAHVVEHGVSVDARHHEIENDDVVVITVEILDRFRSVAGGV